MGLSYEEGKKVVLKGMILLAVVTLVEVLIALVGNGHIIDGFHLPKIIMYPLMIGLSLYKAYFIVYEFMHMRYEVKGLAMSVLLPTLLLVWGVIAFLQEGSSWGSRRALIKSKNAVEVSEYKAPEKAPEAETKSIEQ
jgi:cytochrome c oxidase subunit IV